MKSTEKSLNSYFDTKIAHDMMTYRKTPNGPLQVKKGRVILFRKLVLPFRFRKAGRVWCGGARETH